MSPQRRGFESPTLEDIRLNRQSLSDLSAPMLRKIIRQLQQQLSQTESENADLLRQLQSLDNLREVPGRNDDDVECISVLRQELKTKEVELALQDRELQEKESKLGLQDRELKTKEMELSSKDRELHAKDAELSSKEKELLAKESELDIYKDRLQESRNSNAMNSPDSGDGGTISDLQNQVIKLTLKLGGAEEMAAIFKEQLSMNLQSEGFPGGVNPDLLVKLVGENQRLKSDLAKLEEKTESLSMIPTLGHEQVNIRKGSHIPRPVKPTHKALFGENEQGNNPEVLKPLLLEAKHRIDQLEQKLHATEGTVRLQGQKMKYYKNLLNENGLSCRSPMFSRSSSLNNLNTLGHGDSHVLKASSRIPIRKRAASHENLHSVTSSVDSAVGSSGEFDNLKDIVVVVNIDSMGTSNDRDVLKLDVQKLKDMVNKQNIKLQQLNSAETEVCSLSVIC